MIPRRPGASVMAKGTGERRPAGGPYDVDSLGPDVVPLAGIVDFGALRVPVPDGGTVTVEPTAGGRMQAVHVTVGEGRLSVSALAAPKSASLWPDLAQEIDSSLREGGARVRSFPGEWGRELHATTGAATSVFVGVDGPRWMLYGVATGPSRDAVALDARLRIMVRGTVVVRGRSPYPVRTVLPLLAPAELAPDAATASGRWPAVAPGTAPTAGPTRSAPAAAADRPASQDAVRTTALRQVPPAARAASGGAPPERPGTSPGAATAAFSAVVRAARPGPEMAAGATGPVPPVPARAEPSWADPVRRVGDDLAGAPAGRWDPLVPADPAPSGTADPPTRWWPAGPGGVVEPPQGRRRRRPADAPPVGARPGEHPVPARAVEDVHHRDPAILDVTAERLDPVAGPDDLSAFPTAGAAIPTAGAALPRSDRELAGRRDELSVRPTGGASDVRWEQALPGGFDPVARRAGGPAGDASQSRWDRDRPGEQEPLQLLIFDSLLAGEPADGVPGRHAAPESGASAPGHGAGVAPAEGGATSRAAGHQVGRDAGVAPGGRGRSHAGGHRSGRDGPVAPDGDGATSRAAGRRAAPEPHGPAGGVTDGHRVVPDPGGRSLSGGRRAAAMAPADPADPETTDGGPGWVWPEQSEGRRRSRDASWSAADLLVPDQPGPRRRRAAPEPRTTPTGRHSRPED